MEIFLNFIGATIVELEVQTPSTDICEDISDLNGKIDEDFIIQLQELVNDMINHNESL